MRTLTISEFNSRFPKGNSSYFDGLTSAEQMKYVELYSLYASLLNLYCIRNFEFAKYDKILLDSPYKFPVVEDDDMDMYQFLASDYLNYLYVRNNCYIERLSDDEWNYLVGLSTSVSKDDDILYDDSIDSFIGNSFKKVISEDSENILFGSENSNAFADGNGLVVGVRYDNYKMLPGQNDEDFFNCQTGREQDLDMLESIINARVSKSSSLPVTTIVYNEYNTYPRTDNNENLKEKDAVK